MLNVTGRRVDLPDFVLQGLMVSGWRDTGFPLVECSEDIGGCGMAGNFFSLSMATVVGRAILVDGEKLGMPFQYLEWTLVWRLKSGSYSILLN